MRNDWFFDKVFPIVFIGMFVFIMGTFMLSGYMYYQCYSSKDPNNIACYMITDRTDANIRIHNQ